MLPDTIELPRAQDICKHKIRQGDKQSAIGWLQTMFDACSYDYWRAVDAMDDLVNNARHEDENGIQRWCNSPQRTFRQIASAIEQTVLAMGYELEESP